MRVLLAVSLVVASGLIGATPVRAADGECDAFEVFTPKHGSMSTVARLVLPAGSSTELRKFGNEVNAIGYAASQNLLYGVSTRSQVVSIDRSGVAVDRGKVFGIGDATAGAITGNTLYLRDGLKLVSLDINPASPTYLKIIKWKWLSWFADVDDFDFGSDALLYGVTSGGVVTSIDPVRGTVRSIARPKALPFGTYGAVLMSPGRILYAINNRANGKSRLYRIPLNAPDTTTEVASFAPADTTDAAGCLPAPPVNEPPGPPPPPQPPVPPSPPAPPKPAPPQKPAPPPTTTTTTTTTTRPPVREPAPTTPTTPAQTTKPRRNTPVAAQQAAAPIKPDTQKKRRWALTTLVIVLGAGAALAAVARHR